MKKKFLMVLPIVIILVIAFVIARGRPVSSEYFILQERDFMETLVASGRVEPGQRLTLAYQVSGVVGEVFFSEGDSVEHNQVVVQLDTSREHIQLGLARSEVKLAEAFILSQSNEMRQQAQQAFNQALINTRTALETYQQVQSLRDIGGASQQDVQDARDAWEIASSQEVAALSRLQSVQAGGASCMEAMARLEQAQLRVQEAEIALEQKKLRTPIDGRILSVGKFPGEYVAPGEAIMTLAHLQQMVVVDIDEKEYPQLQQGLPAVVMSQADSTKTSEAEVVFIAPAVDPRKGTVEVRLHTTEPEVVFMTDAAVTVEIILSEQTGLQAFPERFLSEDPDGYYVWTINDDEARKIYLTGISRWQGWIIPEGLELGTMILHPASLREGRRVQADQEVAG